MDLAGYIYIRDDARLTTNLSVLGDSKGDSTSTHDKIEEKLKACTQAERKTEQVNATTYQGTR